MNLINQIESDLAQELELSNLAVEFKEKVKSKYDFVTKGLELLSNNVCPFCEQFLEEDALSLIDRYNLFLKDTEAKTIKRFEDHIKALSNLSLKINSIQDTINKKKIVFDSYTSNYIFSMQSVSLKTIEDTDIKNICDQIEEFMNKINEKIKNISKPLIYDNKIINKLGMFNEIIKNNNELILQLNRKKNDINEESKNIRRIICKLVYNELLIINQPNKTALIELLKQIKKKKEEIKVKLATVQLDRKEIVSKTIKKVLKY